MRWRIVSMLVLLACSASASAALTVHIQQLLERRIAIGVADFSGPMAGEALGDIIRQDLMHGPGLRVAEQPVRAWQPGVIAYSETSAQEPIAQYIVQGFVQQLAPQRFHFSYAVVEPAKQQVIFSGQLKAGNGRWRAVAHHISDAIYEKLVGVAGVASRHIIYVQTQGERHQLMIADSDGVGARVLLDSASPILSPSWSPDGQRVVYVSFEDGQSAIYSQDLRSGERARLTALTGTSAAPSWSPDGQRIAMALSAAGNTDIYVYRLSDGDLQRVTEHAAIDTEPRWRADGQSLMFTSDRSGSAQIYSLDINAGSTQRVSFAGRFNAHVAVDPNQGALATVHDSGDGRYRVALFESQRTPWLLSDAALASAPEFAPNGLLLSYTESSASGERIAFVSRDGKQRWYWPARAGSQRDAIWSPY